MKKGDIIWLALLIAVLFLMLSPLTNHTFEQMTLEFPYLLGFVKFAILATMGELLALRIAKGDYVKPAGFVWRVIIWGIIGILITLMFKVFAGGVLFALDKGFLPFKGNQIAFAFFTSLLMNAFFAPTFMALHKHTDTYLDLRQTNKNVALTDVVEAIDWQNFVSFVVLKTIPFFWIPAHTITFLLPVQYRVMVAALLSIALGLILSLSKKSRD